MIALVAMAFGADTYVNGALVDPRSLVGLTIERATVRFDDKGNVLIEAPGYKLQVLSPAPRTSSAPAATVSAGRWWVVVEDKGSIGHTVEVWVNSQLVQTFRSGEGAKVVDIARWLRLGRNQVQVNASSASPAGGTLTVFVGAGGSDKGYFELAAPQVEFGLTAGKSGTIQRDYLLTVDR